MAERPQSIPESWSELKDVATAREVVERSGAPNAGLRGGASWAR